MRYVQRRQMDDGIDIPAQGAEIIIGGEIGGDDLKNLFPFRSPGRGIIGGAARGHADSPAVVGKMEGYPTAQITEPAGDEDGSGHPLPFQS